MTQILKTQYFGNRNTRLFLLASESVQASAVIAEMSPHCSEIIACSSVRYGYGTGSSRVSKVVLYNNDESLLDILREHSSAKPSLIIPMTDNTSFFVSSNSDELEALGYTVVNPTREQLLSYTDKYLLGSLLEASGLSNLGTRELDPDCASDQKYPLIAKPRFGAGARGFAILRSSSEYMAFVDTLTMDSSEYFTQCYVPHSRQFKVTGAVLDGRVLCSAALEKKRYFPVKAGSSTLCAQPATKTYESYLLETLREVAALTAWTGVLDLDIISTPELDWSNILEINPRVPACYAHYYKNGYRFLSSLALGHDVSLPKSKHKPTQYVGLDAMRAFGVGPVGFGVWIRDLMNPRVQTYELLQGDLKSALFGTLGQISRMTANLREKKS